MSEQVSLKEFFGGQFDNVHAAIESNAKRISKLEFKDEQYAKSLAILDKGLDNINTRLKIWGGIILFVITPLYGIAAKTVFGG